MKTVNLEELNISPADIRRAAVKDLQRLEALRAIKEIERADGKVAPGALRPLWMPPEPEPPMQHVA